MSIIRYEIQQAQRPADEVILTDEDVMKKLNICKRTLLYMKSRGIIAYHKIESRSYYLLSDLLRLMKESRVEAIQQNLRIAK